MTNRELIYKEMNKILLGDSTKLIKNIESESIHAIVSDIPYGISYDEWDVLHKNTNSALLGASQAQKKQEMYLNTVASL